MTFDFLLGFWCSQSLPVVNYLRSFELPVALCEQEWICKIPAHFAAIMLQNWVSGKFWAILGVYGKRSIQTCFYIKVKVNDIYASTVLWDGVLDRNFHNYGYCPKAGKRVSYKFIYLWYRIFGSDGISGGSYRPKGPKDKLLYKGPSPSKHQEGHFGPRVSHVTFFLKGYSGPMPVTL